MLGWVAKSEVQYTYYNMPLPYGTSYNEDLIIWSHVYIILIK
jgi:hypothetical protein